MNLSDVLNKSIEPKPYSPSHSMFVSDSYVGVEIEMEGVSSSILRDVPSWRSVAEQSVDGWELVLRKPMCENGLYLALNELRGLDVPATAFTERTSVHVHIDVRDMTYLQLINYIALSVMFEPVLYKYVAPHRSSNHFCWSFLDCEALITRVSEVNRAYNTGDSRSVRDAMERRFSVGATKYSGINLSSIPKYGSLEFRMHEGTMNVNAITRWINILLSIKKYAMGEDRTPSNILETKQDVGIDSIFTAVLSDYRGVLSYQGVNNDILKGIRAAQDFVYTINWDESYTLEMPHIEPQIFQRFDDALPSRVRVETDDDDDDDDEDDEGAWV